MAVGRCGTSDWGCFHPFRGGAPRAGSGASPDHLGAALAQSGRNEEAIDALRSALSRGLAIDADPASELLEGLRRNQHTLGIYSAVLEFAGLTPAPVT